jgi:hypothetical protein
MNIAGSRVTFVIATCAAADVSLVVSAAETMVQMLPQARRTASAENSKNLLLFVFFAFNMVFLPHEYRKSSVWER